MIKGLIEKYKIPKLALGLVGHLILSLTIAAFSFGFLSTTSYGVAQRFALEGNYGDIDYQVVEVIEIASFFGALVVFLAMFLYLIGQKLSYILEINKAIGQLEGGNLSYRIAVEKEDELSELAYNLNKLAQTLEAYRSNEEKIEQERVKLVRSLSHDIRTPLTAIISYTDFIKDKKYDSEEKLEAYINIIQSKAYQIKELAQILFDNQQQAGDMGEKEIYNGKVLMDQLMQEYEVILEDEGFQVVTQMEEIEEFQTTMAPQDLVRIFDNLCSNVIKYADKSEQVIFTMTYKINRLTIIQTNSMKPEKSKEVESYGIGLKNIKQIVSQYGGSINSDTLDTKYKIKIQIPI